MNLITAKRRATSSLWNNPLYDRRIIRIYSESLLHVPCCYTSRWKTLLGTSLYLVHLTRAAFGTGYQYKTPDGVKYKKFPRQYYPESRIDFQNPESLDCRFPATEKYFFYLRNNQRSPAFCISRIRHPESGTKFQPPVWHSFLLLLMNKPG